MKDYILYGLNEEKYGVLLLCLTHENIFTFYQDVQQEPLFQNSKGIILLDQLLVTGNGDNRFVSLPYDCGKIDFSKAENVMVSNTIRKISVELLNTNISALQNTILTDDQQEMVRQKIAI